MCSDFNNQKNKQPGFYEYIRIITRETGSKKIEISNRSKIFTVQVSYRLPEELGEHPGVP